MFTSLHQVPHFVLVLITTMTLFTRERCTLFHCFKKVISQSNGNCTEWSTIEVVKDRILIRRTVCSYDHDLPLTQ